MKKVIALMALGAVSDMMKESYQSYLFHRLWKMPQATE